LQAEHRYAKSEIMPTDELSSPPGANNPKYGASAEKRPLTPAAERALAEATARRAAENRGSSPKPKEISGRDGPEPTRYGDWEINGLASDF